MPASNALGKAINKRPALWAMIVGIASVFMFADFIGIDWLAAIVFGGIDGLLFYAAIRGRFNSN
jgi:hypothetical protein